MSDSALLSETAADVLHIQEIGSNVLEANLRRFSQTHIKTVKKDTKEGRKPTINEAETPASTQAIDGQPLLLEHAHVLLYTEFPTSPCAKTYTQSRIVFSDVVSCLVCSVFHRA